MEPYRRNPDGWIQQIFSAKAVERGAVVRRSVAIVEREVGRDRLIEEVDQRGYHLIECGGQFVIICNGGRIRLLR
ncbi:MAG: N-(5'-phosphoribosyl)anthranilate isomerase [Planktomarina sp.]